MMLIRMAHIVVSIMIIFVFIRIISYAVPVVIPENLQI